MLAVYFKKTDGKKWDFNGAAVGGQGSGSNGDHSNLFCSSTFPSFSWSGTSGHQNHYGFSLYPNSCGGGNWNYCESGTSHPGGYDNGNYMSMDIYITSLGSC